MPVEERLEGIPIQELLQHIPTAQRLQGIPTAERLRDLGVDDLKLLRKLLDEKIPAG